MGKLKANLLVTKVSSIFFYDIDEAYVKKQTKDVYEQFRTAIDRACSIGNLSQSILPLIKEDESHNKIKRTVKQLNTIPDEVINLIKVNCSVIDDEQDKIKECKRILLDASGIELWANSYDYFGAENHFQGTFELYQFKSPSLNNCEFKALLSTSSLKLEAIKQSILNE